MLHAEAFNQDPEFFSFMKTLESYDTIVGDNTSLVISSDSDIYKYLKKVDPN